MIPLGALCGEPLTFTGHGKLVTRPLQAYYDIFDRQELSYTTASNGYLPLTVNGVLKSGDYELPGNVSSQFISGLLFALPLLAGDSVLKITSALESQSYVDLTLSCLANTESLSNTKIIINIISAAVRSIAAAGTWWKVTGLRRRSGLLPAR